MRAHFVRIATGDVAPWKRGDSEVYVTFVDAVALDGDVGSLRFESTGGVSDG